MNHFSVIGAGNLGANLLRALAVKEADYALRYIYKHSKFAAYAGRVTQNMAQLVRESDLVFICTQESRIAAAAETAAAGSDPGGKIFFHTSNSLTSDELIALRRKGAYTASFSPLQTFPGFAPEVDLFRGIYFLAEGDEKALDAAEKIAADLNANLLRVDKEDKIYYHMAAVCASNFLISILKLSENQLKKTGGPVDEDEKDKKGTGYMNGRIEDPIKVMLPLIRQTLANVETKGVTASLSGPVKRKETGVVEKHLQRLEGKERALYQALSDFLNS